MKPSRCVPYKNLQVAAGRPLLISGRTRRLLGPPENDDDFHININPQELEIKIICDLSHDLVETLLRLKDGQGDSVFKCAGSENQSPNGISISSCS